MNPTACGIPALSRHLLGLSALLVLIPAPAAADRNASIPEVRLVRVAEGFRRPVDLAAAGRDLYVVEQEGRIREIRRKRVLLDLRDRVTVSPHPGDERGLLGLAFHPRDRSRLFVDYTTGGRELRTRISEFRGGRERVILEIPQPYANHNGGQLTFGPDGYLYIGTGDGGGANDPHNHGQRLDTLLGKILRLDVDSRAPYGIPPDNPFVRTPGARPEIYAYGLRNPWRFSFDRETGWLYVGDVGQSAREEVDVVVKGGNYGWRVMEGSLCTPGVNPDCDPVGILPIYEYGRRQGISVIGGYVYRGSAHPALRGVYLFADYGSGNLWGLRYDGRRVTAHRLLLKTDLRISSFGQDASGEVYLLDHRGGAVYRLVAP